MTIRQNIFPIRNLNDRVEAISLLEEGFPGKYWWKDVVGDLKLTDDTHKVMILKIDGVSQGVMLLFEHERYVNGRKMRFVNISSWYVRLSYRNFTIAMLEKVIEGEDRFITIFTPSKSVQRRCLAAGFRLFSNGSILSLPFLNNKETSRRVSIRLIKADEPFNDMTLSFTSQAILGHCTLPFVALEVSDINGEIVAKIVFRFFLRKHIKFCRMIFNDNPEFVVASLSAIKKFLFLRYFCIGIYFPNLHPYNALRNYFPNIQSPSIVVKGLIPDADIDLLYSEYLYLPI
jgi:hypothetical protein